MKMDVTQVTSLTLLTLSLAATIFWFLYRLLENINIKSFKERNVKYVNFPSQFLSQLRKKVFHFIEKQEIDKHGTVFGFNLFFNKTIMVAEPELLQIVLNKEFTNFPNRRKVETEDPIFKRFLFATEDEEWKRVRMVVTPVFSTGKLRRIKYVIDDTANTLLKNLENFSKQNEIVDIKQMMGGFTMDTIIQVGFGVKVDSLVDPNNPIIVNVKNMFSVDLPYREIFNSALVFIMPKIANLLGVRLNSNETSFFHKISMEIIKKKRQELEEKKSFGKGNNLIEIMLEAEAENQNDSQNRLKYITNEEIISQSILFFIVGYDTTATTISTACYLLAMNPDKQEKLYEDIIKVIEELKNESEDKETDPIKLVTFDSLNRFKYLDAVVNESLRIYGPATAIERRAAKNMNLSTEDGRININLKKDDIVRIPLYYMHHSERFFKDAKSFIPERFLGTPQHDKFAFLPFGSGPRRCLATQLAQLEVKMALLHTIRCYKLSKSTKTKNSLEFFIQADIQIAREIHLNVHKR